jgi:hypothetical protein
MFYIECDVSPGAFSGELAFEIILNGEKHVGLAAKMYFFAKDGKQLGDVTTKTKALIMARVLREEEDGEFLVSIPDGEVIRVKKDHLITSGSKNVPVGS